MAAGAETAVVDSGALDLSTLGDDDLFHQAAAFIDNTDAEKRFSLDSDAESDAADDERDLSPLGSPEVKSPNDELRDSARSSPQAAGEETKQQEKPSSKHPKKDKGKRKRKTAKITEKTTAEISPVSKDAIIEALRSNKDAGANGLNGHGESKRGGSGGRHRSKSDAGDDGPTQSDLERIKRDLERERERILREQSQNEQYAKERNLIPQETTWLLNSDKPISCWHGLVTSLCGRPQNPGSLHWAHRFLS